MKSGFACVAALPALWLSAAAATPDAAPGRLVIQFRENADTARAAKLLSSRWARTEKTVDPLGIAVITVPEDAADAIAAELQQSGLFNYVERDYFAHGAGAPNDPSFKTQWHLAAIRAADAWNISVGTPGAPIAIIDSGVDANHPDLAGRIAPGWSFLSNSADTSDMLGHGTAVTGTAAAATNNGIGVAGVSWSNPIMPLVVLDRNDSAAYSDIARAIVYAADRGVRVINVSVSGAQPSATLQNAIDYAWNKGAIVFAAAGNAGNMSLSYPAACNHAVAVAATDSSDAHASFSNYGPWITLSAPGKDILTTTRGGGYAQWYGTSFASPIAAGVAALVLSIQPSMANAALISLLEQSADDLGAPGFDAQYGWGRINAYRAVTLAAGISNGASAGRPPRWKHPY
jgi:subtilisin family serine protease